MSEETNQVPQGRQKRGISGAVQFTVILVIAAAGIFLAGLAYLFHLRFSAGDIYPAYSSLRADPMGSRAYYESLGRLLSARRHYQALQKLGQGRDTTLFYLGVPPEDAGWTPEEFQAIDAFLRGGGRLVVALLPEYKAMGARKSFRTGRAKRQGDADDEIPPEFRRVSIEERWGLKFEIGELPKDDQGVYRPASAARRGPDNLPETLACHSALFFTNSNPDWRVIYARSVGRAVVIERWFGAGSVVVCADAYPFSNEALLKERLPDLLAWFVGPNHRVVFDEAHLGVQEQAGLAALSRKYRLHGVFATLLLLAGLFVWKNSAAFLPPRQQRDQPQGEMVAGKEIAAGFVNLLRRGISRRELLAVCLGEWKKSCATRVPRARLERVQKVIDGVNASPAQPDPVQTYQTIHRILTERK